MLAKMKPVSASGEGGSRIAVIFNGSPMYVGGAGSGESNIRRWIVENDWLEAVVALPDLLFPNTGIHTYFCGSSATASPHNAGARYCC
ncbi:hypothetical protein SALBM135S_01256 [Streptomyces alboniger]